LQAYPTESAIKKLDPDSAAKKRSAIIVQPWPSVKLQDAKKAA